MTTTKKKAKRTLAQRVTALEDAEAGFAVLAAQVNEVVSGMQGFDMRLTGTRERLTALEQAQRPAEKPATEKRAGPWSNHVWNGRGCGDSFRYAGDVRVCTVGQVGGADSPWRAWVDGGPVGGTHQDYPTEADAQKACDAVLLARGWTLEAQPSPATSEESRLRDAVVRAAISVVEHGHSLDDHLIDDVKALRAHRAKKGGA